jgi:8-oxo-dGTP pyrophosphatase MutT (NUDIX family)
MSSWPVSIKGVVLAAGHVLLLQNERDEWELPGGRLEVGEDPEQCVVREIAEETDLTVAVDRIVDAWTYPVLVDRTVLIVTYACHPLDHVPAIAISSEHRDARFVPVDDCDSYPMPDGYRRSISTVCG